METQPRVRFDSFLIGVVGSLTTSLFIIWLQSKSSGSVTGDIIEEQELRGPGRREE